jgi:RecG-like helicase
MGALRRWLVKITETDEARLDAEVRDWANSVPGSVRISGAPMRERIKIAGVIRRLTVFPTKDDEALETVVSDGTGDVVVRFTGRRAIGGLTLGTRVVVVGVLGQQHGRVQMMNPVLELTV